MNLDTEFTTADFVILKVFKKMKKKKKKITRFFKEKIFQLRQNFADANQQFSNLPRHLRWHLPYADGNCKGYYRQCVPFVILKPTLDYNILILLSKTAITTTFYFPAEVESVCIRKKQVRVNRTGHDLDVSFL